MVGGFRLDFLVFDPRLPEEEDMRTHEEVGSEADAECGAASDLQCWRKPGSLLEEEELDVHLLAICQERSEKKHDSTSNSVNSLSCLVLRPPDEDNGKEYERIGVVHFLEGEGWTEFFDWTQTEAITIV